MRIKRIAVGAATVVALAAGSAGAIAATDDDAKQTEQQVLDDAAKRLDVTPERLRSALGAAQDAQLDQAVKDGALTQAQVDEIKQRRQENGRVLGLGRHGGPGHVPGGHGDHRGGPGRGRGKGMLKDVAKALGLTGAELRTQLEDGKSLAEVAKAENKQLDAVKRAVRAANVERLAAKVKAGRLTDAQRDAMVEHLDERINRLGDAKLGRPHGMRPGADDRGNGAGPRN